MGTCGRRPACLQYTRKTSGGVEGVAGLAAAAAWVGALACCVARWGVVVATTPSNGRAAYGRAGLGGGDRRFGAARGASAWRAAWSASLLRRRWGLSSPLPRQACALAAAAAARRLPRHPVGLSVTPLTGRPWWRRRRWRRPPPGSARGGSRAASPGRVRVVTLPPPGGVWAAGSGAAARRGGVEGRRRRLARGRSPGRRAASSPGGVFVVHPL